MKWGAKNSEVIPFHVVQNGAGGFQDRLGGSNESITPKDGHSRV